MIGAEFLVDAAVANDVKDDCDELVSHRHDGLLFPATKIMRRGADVEPRPVSGFSKAKLKLDAIIAKHDAKHGRRPMVPWTLHDIRRSVATEMARLGIPGDHVERVLGHVLGGVKEVYQHYDYLAEKRAALDLWGEQWTA